MKINLSCVGGCAQYVPGGATRTSVDVAGGSSILDVLGSMGVSRDLFMFALVNGRRADLSIKLREGDDVVLVSALSGG